MSYDPGFDGVIGALPLNRPSNPSAKDKLQRSQLKLSQREMMGDDIDLTNFFATFDGAKFNLRGAILDASVERTVQGASQLTVTVTDPLFQLLDSGWLSNQLRVEIDGLYWMLASIGLQGTTVTLNFQEQEVVVARRYDKPIKQSMKTSRRQITRAEFALRLLREIKELPPIPYVIPALKVPQPLTSKAAWLAHKQERVHKKGLGIADHNNLTVKGTAMTPEQQNNSEQILATGASMALPRKYLVAAIMCTMQESSIINLRQPLPGAGNYLGPDPGGNPVGCFQQIKNAGWPASRDIPKDATAFYQHLSSVYSAHPTYDIATAVYTVQNPGGGSAAIHAYARWQAEAERIVDAYGVVPGGQGSAADANNTYNFGAGDVTYEFYRGRPPTSTYMKKHSSSPQWGKENTWDCWQRLASEVQWRCFFVSGTFYFISEDDLFKQHPLAVIDGNFQGVESFDGTYDSQGAASSMTVTCRIGRWAVPPGGVVELRDLGPWTGRWLVNDVTRGLFSSQGTIVLKKPLPALPEPDSSNVATASGPQNGKWSVGGKGTSGSPTGDAIVAIAKKAEEVPGASTSYLYGGVPGLGLGSHTDCSGFVLAVYREAGITKTPNGNPFPRTSQAQWSEASVHPSQDRLQPGDLVFFDYEGPHSHVGIYIGSNPSGTGGLYIGDQHTGSGITTEPIDYAHYDGAARYTP